MSKVVFITGASRGIGRAFAHKFAESNDTIIIAAKTDMPHPKLEGTIHTVAKEVKELGGNAYPIVLDVRDEEQIALAFEKVKQRFGQVDVLINNASAISLSDTSTTLMKRFDLMHAVNVRATFACSQAAIPLLKHADNPHIITLSPPLTLDAKWYGPHLAYTLSKMGMSLCTLGLAEELKEFGIAVNSLWPKTTIATDAIKVHFPKEIYEASRFPSIVADAAYLLSQKLSTKVTGQFFTDEELLLEAGINNFSRYAVNPLIQQNLDLFL